MKQPLLPLTKILVATSGLVPLVFGSAQVFAPDFVNKMLWPPPFEPVPKVVLLFLAASYFALTIGAVYVLMKNDWATATGYLAYAVSYVALAIVAGLVAATREGGVPSIMWLYEALAILYVPIALFCWRQQSKRASAPAA